MPSLHTIPAEIREIIYQFYFKGIEIYPREHVDGNGVTKTLIVERHVPRHGSCGFDHVNCNDRPVPLLSVCSLFKRELEVPYNKRLAKSTLYLDIDVPWQYDELLSRMYEELSIHKVKKLTIDFYWTKTFDPDLWLRDDYRDIGTAAMEQFRLLKNFVIKELPNLQHINIRSVQLFAFLRGLSTDLVPRNAPRNLAFYRHGQWATMMSGQIMAELCIGLWDLKRVEVERGVVSASFVTDLMRTDGFMKIAPQYAICRKQILQAAEDPPADYVDVLAEYANELSRYSVYIERHYLRSFMNDIRDLEGDRKYWKLLKDRHIVFGFADFPGEPHDLDLSDGGTYLTEHPDTD